MKNFDVRYVVAHRKWVVIAPTALVLPPKTLGRIAESVKSRWDAELKRLNPITDGSKCEFIRTALRDLQHGVEQVFINSRGDIPLFESTVGEGKIYG